VYVFQQKREHIFVAGSFTDKLMLSFACPKESIKEKDTRRKMAARHQIKLKIRNSYRQFLTVLKQPNFFTPDLMSRYSPFSRKGSWAAKPLCIFAVLYFFSYLLALI